MDYVKVNKDDLIRAIISNKNEHIKKYNDAIAGYKTKLIEKLYEAVELAIHDKELITTIIMPAPKPINHKSDYDLAIGMLEMSVEEIVEISDEQYRNFILDDWSWKSSFTTSSTSYSSSSSSNSE